MYAAKIDLLFESALLLASVCFSLGVYVLSRGVANKLNLAYSSLSLCISFWAFSFFVANVLEWRLWESLHILSTLMLAPLSLLFLKVLLRPEGFVFEGLLRVSLAGAFLLVLPVTFGLDRTALIRDLSYFSPTLIVVAMLYLLLSETLGAVLPRGGNFPKISTLEMRQALRRRNVWLYLGGALVTLLCVMDRVPWMGRTLPSIGNLLLALYAYFLKDVVLHESLVSSRRMIGRFVVTFLGAFICFLIFISITTWVKNNLALYLINAFFAAFVAAVSLDPVRKLAAYAFQTFFFKEASRVGALIQDASKEIAGAFHGQAIAGATNRFLQKALGGPMVSFYALSSEGTHFRKILDGTVEQSLPETIPAVFPLVQYWKQGKGWAPILSEELEKVAERETLPFRVAAVQLARESLQSLQSAQAFPLVHDRSVLGFATMNLKEPPEPWGDSWGGLTLLSPYFERAGEALRELDMYARLRERDRLATIGEMAAGLAHEIRNPLGAIKGAAQVLEPKKGDPQEPFLRIIVEEVNRLNAVVTQFLNYAKPFQGEAQWAQLKDVVLAARDRYAGKFEKDGIDFQVKVPDSMPLLRCQPGLLDLVLTNLLENSYRAVSNEARKGQKKPTITLRLAHTIRDGEVEVSLGVEDNGPGMTPEVLDKIFIPFFTASPQGTGLGLSICQKIAEAHSGRMEASSVPGEGTLMTLRFSAERKE